MRRLLPLLPVLVTFLVGAVPAHAWTWPVDGPVLRPFVFGDDPYAAGQHRGIDIGADTGTPVRAPVSGTVSFSGTVPHGGRTVTIQSSDGYSVTLVHLGTADVRRGASVGEGSIVGTVGPTGDPDVDVPYVYLGVRVTADPQGYVDPLGLLPPASSTGGGDDEGGSTDTGNSGSSTGDQGSGSEAGGRGDSSGGHGGGDSRQTRTGGDRAGSRAGAPSSRAGGGDPAGGDTRQSHREQSISGPDPARNEPAATPGALAERPGRSPVHVRPDPRTGAAVHGHRIPLAVPRRVPTWRDL